MPDIVRVGKEDKVHPSWQAYSYASTISNFNEYVESSGLEVDTCTFLHNYKRQYAEELLDPVYTEGIELAKPFISDQYDELAEFISRYITKPSKNKILFEIDNGEHSSSFYLPYVKEGFAYLLSGALPVEEGK